MKQFAIDIDPLHNVLLNRVLKRVHVQCDAFLLFHDWHLLNLLGDLLVELESVIKVHY